MSTLSKQGAKIAAPVSDEQLKWLNWPDFCPGLSSHLRCRVAALHGHPIDISSATCPQLHHFLIWVAVAMQEGSCQFHMLRMDAATSMHFNVLQSW